MPEGTGGRNTGVVTLDGRWSITSNLGTPAGEPRFHRPIAPFRHHTPPWYLHIIVTRPGWQRWHCGVHIHQSSQWDFRCYCALAFAFSPQGFLSAKLRDSVAPPRFPMPHHLTCTRLLARHRINTPSSTARPVLDPVPCHCSIFQPCQPCITPRHGIPQQRHLRNNSIFVGSQKHHKTSQQNPIPFYSMHTHKAC